MSTLQHTPAHSIDVPDSFHDEKTGITIEVRPDEMATDPRADHPGIELWGFRVPRLSSTTTSDRRDDDNLGVNTFARVLESTNDADKALEITRRYLRVTRPDEPWSIITQSIHGYSQGDWAELVLATPGADQEEYLHGVAEQYRMWAFGDVWSASCDAPDAEDLYGIYADGPEEAAQVYLQQIIDEGVLDQDGRPEPVEPTASVQRISLTPYDTGERLEATPWIPYGTPITEATPAENFGKVDFDDEFGDTRLTIHVEHTRDRTEVVIAHHEEPDRLSIRFV